MPYAILIIKVPETIARVSACIAVRYLQMYVQHRGTDSGGGRSLTTTWDQSRENLQHFLLLITCSNGGKFNTTFLETEGYYSYPVRSSLAVSSDSLCWLERYDRNSILSTVLEKLHGKRITPVHAVALQGYWVLVNSEKTMSAKYKLSASTGL